MHSSRAARRRCRPPASPGALERRRVAGRRDRLGPRAVVTARHRRGATGGQRLVDRCSSSRAAHTRCRPPAAPAGTPAAGAVCTSPWAPAPAPRPNTCSRWGGRTRRRHSRTRDRPPRSSIRPPAPTPDSCRRSPVGVHPGKAIAPVSEAAAATVTMNGAFSTFRFFCMAMVRSVLSLARVGARLRPRAPEAGSSKQGARAIDGGARGRDGCQQDRKMAVVVCPVAVLMGARGRSPAGAMSRLSGTRLICTSSMFQPDMGAPPKAMTAL